MRTRVAAIVLTLLVSASTVGQEDQTQAMLALNRPCEVLVMLEAAHDALDTSNAPKHRQ